VSASLLAPCPRTVTSFHFVTVPNISHRVSTLYPTACHRALRFSSRALATPTLLTLGPLSQTLSAQNFQERSGTFTNFQGLLETHLGSLEPDLECTDPVSLSHHQEALIRRQRHTIGIVEALATAAESAAAVELRGSNCTATSGRHSMCDLGF
jgi:hypothetical protein